MNTLEIGKNYGGVFGAKKAVYQGGDTWYFEHLQETDAAALAATQKLNESGIFAVYAKATECGYTDAGFIVSFSCEKPEATKAALKA